MQLITILVCISVLVLLLFYTVVIQLFGCSARINCDSMYQLQKGHFLTTVRQISQLNSSNVVAVV